MASCELCGTDDEILHPTAMPKDRQRNISLFACGSCLRMIPKKVGGEYTQDPRDWWRDVGKDRYRTYGDYDETDEHLIFSEE